MNICPEKNLFTLSRLIFFCLLIFLIHFHLLENFSSHYGSCYWYTHYHRLCPFCGVTRTFFSLIKLDFKQALSLNLPFAVAVYPFVFFIVLQDIIISLINLLFNKHFPSLLLFWLQSFHLEV